MRIDINNLSGVEIDSKLIKKITSLVLKEENKSVSIALVDEKTIKEINKKYRNKNKKTDVLSFPEKKEFPNQKDYLGEVIICPSQAEKIEKVLVHGLLHLLGYDHEKSQSQAEKMRKKEESFLKDIPF